MAATCGPIIAGSAGIGANVAGNMDAKSRGSPLAEGNEMPDPEPKSEDPGDGRDAKFEVACSNFMLEVWKAFGELEVVIRRIFFLAEPLRSQNKKEKQCENAKARHSKCAIGREGDHWQRATRCHILSQTGRISMWKGCQVCGRFDEIELVFRRILFR